MGLSRRDTLGLAALSFSLGSKGMLYGLKEKSDYRVPNSYIEDHKFSNYLSENYYDSFSFDYDSPNVLIDLRYIEGVEKESCQTKRSIEDFFNDIGINMMVLERKEEIEESLFFGEYSNYSDDILGENHSLWDNEVEEFMKDAGIQVFYVPEYILRDESSEYLGGICVQDSEYPRAAVSDELDDDVGERALAHEIGHALGLGHHDDINNVMYREAVNEDYGSLTESQEKEIMSNLG